MYAIALASEQLKINEQDKRERKKTRKAADKLELDREKRERAVERAAKKLALEREKMERAADSSVGIKICYVTGLICISQGEITVFLSGVNLSVIVYRIIYVFITAWSAYRLFVRFLRGCVLHLNLRVRSSDFMAYVALFIVGLNN